MARGTRKRRTVKSTETALAIVEHLKERDAGRVTEIADELGLAKSTVHNHLATLRKHGYVDKVGDAYKLGMRFLHLGEEVRRRDPGFEFAESKVEKLAEKTNERTQFIVENNGKGIYLARAMTPDAVRAASGIGEYTPLHASAAGKSILASLPDERVDEILEEHGLPAMTENTITDPATLREELAEIEDRGYAINRSEKTSGLWAVGVPVFRPDGQLLGALSVSGPEFRMKGRMDELIDLLLGTANELELNLTYS